MARSRTRRPLVVGLVLLLLGALVVVLVTLAVAWQRNLIYLPDRSPVPPAADVLRDGRDLSLRTADGLELGAWFLPGRDAGPGAGYAVLVLPGNAGNRLGRTGLAEELGARGFAVLLLDYRGYGGNPGDPSEEGLAADADAAVAALAGEGFDQDRRIYLGESLGTGVATGLAARTAPAGMVLRSPFPTLADLGAHHYPWLPVRTFLRDRFPVVEHLRPGGEAAGVPVTVVRGDADEVVPPRLSREVAAAARESGNLVDEVVLPGAGHNDPVMFGSRIADAVVDLVRG